MIIVEGIDRVGKTTVAKKISDAFGIKIFDNPYIESYRWLKLDGESGCLMDSKPGTSDMFANVERMNVLLNFVEQFGCKNFIADRFHVSEYVYGACSRKYLNLKSFIEIDDRLANLGAIIVYVRPKDIKWSSAQHGSDLSEHFKVFERAMEMTRCKVYTCDCDSLDSVVEKLKTEVNVL